MMSYRRTRHVGAVGFGITAIWTVFVAVVRIVNAPLDGIDPEAFALTAMMTAPLTLGVVLLAALVSVGLETTVGRGRPARA